MAGTKYTASLTGGSPWGFRLQGGKDFGNPLSISKVTPGSKGATAGIEAGDYVIEINGDSVDDMTHFDAQDAIRRAGQSLTLFLEKKAGPKPIVVTEVVHCAKVDHKYNAMAKPFGASTPPSQPKQLSQPQAPVAGRTSPAGGSSWQPPTTRQPQAAHVVRTGPAGGDDPPPPPPLPSVAMSWGPYDHSDAAPVHRAQHDDRGLAEGFKLNISDDGDVGFADEPPVYGHPPDPKIQSKSFKRLQKHLDHSEEDDLPPPPPEAFDDPDDEGGDKKVQSRTFKMLQDAVESGDAPASVFSRPKDDRSKPSTTPLPKLYRPSPPVIRPAHDRPQAPPAPVMTRPGQPAPVALPGMVQMAAPASTSHPMRSPSHKLPSSASPAVVSPTSPPGQQEWKRTPTKPPTAQPLEETRTPFCDACGQEVFGPFVSAIGKAWHPDHFVCDGCGDSLQNQGFIEEGGKLYCEKDFNKYFAPHCETCKQPIVGPKSLHVCPKTVPAPSTAMLRAIRQSSVEANGSGEVVKSKQRHINNALTLKKNPQETHTNSTNQTSTYTTPVYGVLYPQKNAPSEKSNWPASSGISNITTVQSVKPRSEPGVGSLREKVISLKEALHVEEERRAKARQGIPVAIQRFREAKMLLSKLERKRVIAEDKVAKLEERIHYQESRLDGKYRDMSETWTNKHKLEQDKSEDLRNIKNIEYEITEVKAAKESSMRGVQDVARRAVILQSALQNADDRCRELNARRRTLQDMIEMYNRRIRDLRGISREKKIKAEKKFLQMNLMEDSIADSIDRFKRAEKRLLPLKIYINQLHESIEQTRHETRNARHHLTNYQQSLKGQKFTFYPFNKQ